MNRKRITWSIVLLGILVAAWYGYKEYTRTHKDLEKVTPHFTVSATGLLQEYETNDSSAAKKYNGRIIEVTGSIKKIEKDMTGFYTVVLGDTTRLSSVRCAMDSLHNSDAATLAEDTLVIIRGACTGFNKDEMGLGSDVILNRCVIIKKGH